MGVERDQIAGIERQIRQAAAVRSGPAYDAGVKAAEVLAAPLRAELTELDALTERLAISPEGRSGE
jgi:hypothetical protein